LNSPVHLDDTCIKPSPARPAKSNITRRCNTDRIPTPADSQAFQGLMQFQASNPNQSKPRRKSMNFINYLLDASDDLLTWNLNDQGFDLAARNKACLMAGYDMEDISEPEPE
jgi:hypothetical protein